MTQQKVVGVQILDYTNKQNRHVAGVSYHLIECDSQQTDNFTGQRVETIYVSDAKKNNIPDLQIGDCIEIYYNRFGSIENISIV